MSTSLLKPVCGGSGRPGRLGRLGRHGRRSPAQIALACPILVALSLALSSCEVRREPAPESTRQLKVAGVRRIMDRPALSPAAWSPDSQALAYSSDQRLRVYSLDHGEQDIGPAEKVSAVAWSRPLDMLAVIDRSIVWTLRPDGTDRRPVVLPGPAAELAWAPGSDRLAVVVRHVVDGQSRSELWLVNHDGGFRRMVTRAPAGRTMHDLQWFPDSLYMLYGLWTGKEPGVTELWRVRISYPDRHEMVLPAPATSVRLAPTGRQLATVSVQTSEGGGQVVLSRLDGTGRFAVTPQTGRYTGIAWSPQGEKIAFAQLTADARAELWAANADGSGHLHLYSYLMEYTDVGIAVATAWSPDGRFLAFGTNIGAFIGPIWLVTLERR